MYDWVTLLYIRNQHIINQLYFRKKSKKLFIAYELSTVFQMFVDTIVINKTQIFKSSTEEVPIVA